MPSDAVVVPLHDIAHGRSGDKGNRCNISVIGYTSEVWPWLLNQLPGERVRLWFAHRGPTQVTRYELPRIWALNFVLDGVLEGGVNGSLNLDGHGKALSFHLLALTVELPEDVVARTRSARRDG